MQLESGNNKNNLARKTEKKIAVTKIRKQREEVTTNFKVIKRIRVEYYKERKLNY